MTSKQRIRASVDRLATKFAKEFNVSEAKALEYLANALDRKVTNDELLYRMHVELDPDFDMPEIPPDEIEYAF